MKIRTYMVAVTVPLALLVGQSIDMPARGDLVSRTEIGDRKRGKALYESRCVACHSLDANRVGPKHRGIFGRRAGRVEGYAYSPSLRQSEIVWGAETLDRWLEGPEALIPGQRMNIRVADRADRADIIAYLRSESEGTSRLGRQIIDDAADAGHSRDGM